ncbi:MAG: Gfo/Idh/MocA family oxidoreductase [Ferruginibacter sp.]
MKKKNKDIRTIFTDRREFLKGSAAILGGAFISATLPAEMRAHTITADKLKIALIGCGSRGAGAALNALSTKGNVELVAMADVFKDRLDTTYNNLIEIGEIKNSVNVPAENKFVGFEAYEKAIALADLVLLVTPAAFRPIHFEAAIKAGKHVFMEKPLASDSPGIRRILATGEQAEKKNLKVLVGLQNRYDSNFQELVTQVKAGIIGNIVSMTEYYMIGPVNKVLRQPGQTEIQYQLRNWRYFNWIWTGSPAGLQIHNTDVVNWVKGSHPVRAQGMGGRTSLKGPEHGDIFDHFFIEYEYADGSKLNSQIRHVNGTYNKSGPYFLGTRGTASLQGGIKDEQGKLIWKNPDKGDAYQNEMDKLFDAVRNNKPMNDTQWGAMSTMTAIMGRMAAHSGKMVEWDDAFNSELKLVPEKFSWDMEPPAKPDENGNYIVPVCGQSPVL